MKLVTISDVHVKSPGDEAEKLLISYLKHPLTLKSDYVCLLGDIFDLMCGPHSEYETRFSEFFCAVDDLVSRGIKIIYVEGNHDLHLKKLFRKKWNEDQFILSQDHVLLSENNVSYYLSHGDDHEIDNPSYQKYKKLIMSPPLRFVANYLLPFFVLEFIGRKASAKSRKRGAYKFDVELVRHRIRNGVEHNQLPQNFIIGGHSHVKDEYLTSSGSMYLNNGYLLKERVFIYIEGQNHQFVSL